MRQLPPLDALIAECVEGCTLLTVLPPRQDHRPWTVLTSPILRCSAALLASGNGPWNEQMIRYLQIYEHFTPAIRHSEIWKSLGFSVMPE